MVQFYQLQLVWFASHFLKFSFKLAKNQRCQRERKCAALCMMVDIADNVCVQPNEGESQLCAFCTRITVLCSFPYLYLQLISVSNEVLGMPTHLE